MFAGFEGSGEAVFDAALMSVDFFFFLVPTGKFAGDGSSVPAVGKLMLADERIDGRDIDIVGIFEVVFGDNEGYVLCVIVFSPALVLLQFGIGKNMPYDIRIPLAGNVGIQKR